MVTESRNGRPGLRSTAMAALPATKMAYQHGASREEIAETVALAIGGGVRRGRARAYAQFLGKSHNTKW
jgi:hypothetical protein